MPRFRNTNIIINFDESIVRAEDTTTKQMVYTADPAKAARQWETDVLFCLESIYANGRVGRMLFDAIGLDGADPLLGSYTRYLVIQPYTPEQEKKSLCNANAGPTDWGLAQTRTRLDNTANQNKGVGSSTIIRYDKARWINGTKCGRFGTQPGGVFHEVLMHEMLHGLRQMAGQMDMSPLPNGWTTMEEFYAILIVNVAMSERGKKVLRKNHTGFTPLEPNLSTSVGFLTDPNHLKWVNWLHSRNAVLFSKVAQVDAKFNPIREFITNLPAWQVMLANPPK